uniref:Syntaphilin n=1 Tax=Gallus gallus TaxID=9031 RepID=A0A8V0YKU5_CHICK
MSLPGSRRSSTGSRSRGLYGRSGFASFFKSSAPSATRPETQPLLPASRRPSPPGRDTYGTSSLSSSSNSGSYKGSDSSPTPRRSAKYNLCSDNHGIKPPTPEQYLTPLQQKEVCIRHLKARLKDTQERLQDRDAEIEDLKTQLSRMQEDWIEEECHRVEAQLALKEARKEIKQLKQVIDTVKNNLLEKDKGLQKYFVDINIQNKKLETLLHSMEVAQNGAGLKEEGAAESAGGSPARSLTRSSTYTKLSDQAGGERTVGGSQTISVDEGADSGFAGGGRSPRPPGLVGRGGALRAAAPQLHLREAAGAAGRRGGGRAGQLHAGARHPDGLCALPARPGHPPGEGDEIPSVQLGQPHLRLGVRDGRRGAGLRDAEPRRGDGPGARGRGGAAQPHCAAAPQRRPLGGHRLRARGGCDSGAGLRRRSIQELLEPPLHRGSAGRGGAGRAHGGVAVPLAAPPGPTHLQHQLAAARLLHRGPALHPQDGLPRRQQPQPRGRRAALTPHNPPPSPPCTPCCPPAHPMEPTADCRAPRWGTWRSARSAPRAASWGRGERGAGWARCPEPLSPRMPRAGRGDTRGGQALSLHTALRCWGCHPAGSPHGTLLSFRLSSHGPGDVAAVGDGEEAAGTGVGAAMGCSLAPLPRNAPCFGRSAAQWDVQEDGGNPLDIEGGNGMESDIPHTRARLSRPQRRPFRSFICFALYSLSFPFGKVGALGPGLPAGEWDGAPSWFGCILVHPSQPKPYFPGGGRGGGGRGGLLQNAFFFGGGVVLFVLFYWESKDSKDWSAGAAPGWTEGSQPPARMSAASS